MKLSDLKVNAARAEQGAWVDDIPELPGIRLKVRGFGNSDDRRVQTRELETIPRHKRQRGRASDADQDRIMNARLKEAILVDWEGLTDEAGAPLPMTPELVDQLLTDPDFAKFRFALIWAASIVAEDEAADEKADVKN